ncbi:MAG: adenylate/guanylate cyclase domain-containing protein, partial [Rhodospirillaceae bacterium]
MVRRVRLATGLILFAFVATHLINHSLGIVSLAAMEEGRKWFLLLWRNPAGTALLYVSLILHILLAGYALYARRSLRMSAGDAIRTVLGFSIPLILALHIVGTRGAHENFGTADTYAYVLLAQWRSSPTGAYWQTLGLYAAWIHGCIGLYYWLRLKPGFGQWQPVLFGVAVLLPVLAWIGYYSGGKEVLALAQDPNWLRETYRAISPPNQEQIGLIL